MARTSRPGTAEIRVPAGEPDEAHDAAVQEVRRQLDDGSGRLVQVTVVLPEEPGGDYLIRGVAVDDAQ